MQLLRLAGIFKGQFFRRLENVPLSAVTEEDDKSHERFASLARSRFLLSRGDRLEKGRTQTGQIAQHAKGYALLRQRGDFLRNSLHHQFHKSVDLTLGTAPVLL